MAGYPKAFRPVTDEMRRQVLKDLPELDDLKDKALRDTAIEAWALSIAGSSFNRISEIPGDGNPGVMVLKRGTQDMHLRGVAKLAVDIVDHFAEVFPEAIIDRDIVLCGALCHDIGKAWECDPENQKRWQADPSVVGRPSLRHPVYGAHICLMAGLPEEIAHIAVAHSPEGDNVKRSLECIVVHQADVAWWTVSAAAGLIERETFLEAMTKYFEPRRNRNEPRAAEKSQHELTI
jgi:putative nucleotidyltransferase with HDIG domain